MTRIATQPVMPTGNFMASLKDFVARGGNVNGLNPAVIGRIWYVNGNTETDQDSRKGPIGSDSNNGRTPNSPFLTMERAFEFIDSYDIIALGGVIREQLVAPEVHDITIIGVGNTPRQATDSGVATGGGSSWLPPTSAVAATPLLEIVRQGWTIANIEFNPHTSSAAIRLTTAGGLDEAGQFGFYGNLILGGGTGQIGIEDNGGSGFVVVQGNQFQLLTGTALLGLSTANAVPLSWNINYNQFRQNTNDIKMSLSRARIQENNFMTAGSGATNKVIQTNFIAAQGNNNHVVKNVFTNTAAQIANASGYNGGNADVWSSNYCTDAVQFGIPA